MSPRLAFRALSYFGLCVAAYVSVFPFYWMMVGATNTSADIIKGKAGYGQALWTNVANLFAQVDMAQVTLNSAEIAAIGTLLTLLVSSMAGYGFEMFRTKVSERVFAFLLLLLSIPFAAIMVPLFVTMSQLHIVNTFLAVIIPGVASIFIIFYFRQSSKAFPTELRDAARVDGLKEWQIFVYIYMPVSYTHLTLPTILRV